LTFQPLKAIRCSCIPCYLSSTFNKSRGSACEKNKLARRVFEHGQGGKR
jgi:hypothetical protein